MIIIAHLIWKGSYNRQSVYMILSVIIAHLIWKGSYNKEYLRKAYIKL